MIDLSKGARREPRVIDGLRYIGWRPQASRAEQCVQDRGPVTGNPGVPVRCATRARKHVRGAGVALCPQHREVGVAGGKADVSLEVILIEPHPAAARSAASLDAITVGRRQVGVQAVRRFHRVCSRVQCVQRLDVNRLRSTQARVLFRSLPEYPHAPGSRAGRRQSLPPVSSCARPLCW